MTTILAFDTSTSFGAVCALTSRCFALPLRSALARLNPDLIASNEGGSNQLLVKGPWRIAAAQRHTIARVPERRRMLLARAESTAGHVLAVANLHASVSEVRAAGDQVIDAAAQAVDFAGELPLLFGGDLNLRPATHPDVFESLEKRFRLAPPTAPDAIDHLLARELEVVGPPHLLPASAREVADVDGSLIRLSDHACVVARLGMK